jgi:hypothetical protein
VKGVADRCPQNYNQGYKMINLDLQKRLEKIAYQKTSAFCYSCYKVAPTGICSDCHSDDTMRIMDGVGCEYGTDWVIKELIQENLTSVDCEEIFEQMIEDCYGEIVTIGYMELSTVSIMKDQDPVSWNIGLGEYIDGLVEDGQLVTFDNGSTYYWSHDVENYINEEEETEEAC